MNRIEDILNAFYITLFLSFIFLPQLLFSQTVPDTLKNTEFVLDTIEIPYEEIELDCLCVPKNKYIIIRSYKQLLDLFKNTDDPNCKNFSPTEFDFNKEMIIGFYAILEKIGDKELLLISIKYIPSDNKYICEVKVIHPGGNSTMMPSFLRRTITFPVHSSNCNVEVVIVDYKNNLKQTTKSCYEYY